MKKSLPSLLTAAFSVAVLTLCTMAPLRIVYGENAPAGAPGSALSEVQNTIDLVVKAVENNPGEKNLKERHHQLREILTGRFDFDEMAKLSLGNSWNNISADDQKEFVRIFSELLATTYIDHIDEIRRETVKINSERVVEPKALVKTMVTHKGDTFPIDYKLVKKDQSWKVYDVIIENIGLVTNYRNEFAGIMRKEQFPGLMKRLREKAGV